MASTFHYSEKPKKEGSPKEDEKDDKWSVEKGKDHKGVHLGLDSLPGCL